MPEVAELLCAGVAFLVTSSLVAYIGWAQLKPYVTSEEHPREKQN